MSIHPKSTPLVAPGHTRPVTHLSFSQLQDDGTYLLISSCKDGNPMLREWTGDWIGTFLGHKGAVWSTKLSLDSSRAATASADFTAYVHLCTVTEASSPNFSIVSVGKSGILTLENPCIRSLIITLSAALPFRHQHPTFSPEAKRRKCGFSISVVQMQIRTSSPKVAVYLMMQL